MTVLLLGLQALNGSSQSPPPELHYSIDTGRISIGDLVTLKIALSNIPDNALAVVPDYEAVLQKGTEFVSLITSDTVYSGSTYSIIQEIGLSAYEAGTYWIPSLEFQVQESNSTWTVLRSDSIQLQVATIDVNTDGSIKDIKDIIPADRSTWQQYIILLLCLLVLVAALVWRKKIAKAFFHRQHKTAVSAVDTRMTLLEKYTTALQRLRERDDINNGRYKEHYSELSDILRNYISEQFALPAPELTTQELLKRAKRVAGLKRYRADIKTVLLRSDMAKFAKAQTDETTATADIQLVVNFIRATTKNGIKGSDV